MVLDAKARSAGVLSAVASCILGTRLHQINSEFSLLQSQVNDLRAEFDVFKKNTITSAPKSRSLKNSPFSCNDDGWCTASDHYFLFPRGIVVGQKNSECVYGKGVFSVDAEYGGTAKNCPSGDGSVTFGRGNIASGFKSTVTGGVQNIASGKYAMVSGGYSNIANEYGSSVFGGEYNEANGSSSSVFGGNSNDANGYISSTFAGRSNSANGFASSAVGGEDTIAHEAHSTVIGGQAKTSKA